MFYFFFFFCGGTQTNHQLQRGWSGMESHVASWVLFVAFSSYYNHSEEVTSDFAKLQSFFGARMKKKVTLIC